MKQWIEYIRAGFFSPAFYQFLLGALGALAVLIVTHYVPGFKPAAVGTVNVTGIVDQFIRTETQAGLTPQQMQQRTHDFGQQLERTINQVSREERMTLLPQEAVLAGAPDLTAVVQKRLMNNLQAGH